LALIFSLTPDEKSQIGAIWTKNPCYIKYWDITLNFKIIGRDKGFYADGLAFWY
jgi:mannose-binding-like lectin 2